MKTEFRIDPAQHPRAMIFFAGYSSFQRSRPAIFVVIIAAVAAGCNSHNSRHKPTIEIARVPAAGVGGPEHLDSIEGRAIGAAPGQQIVLYSHNGLWFVQPFRTRSFTKIQPDATWKSLTHLGPEYAALLVEAGYAPASKTAVLPQVGNGVVAVVTVKGRAAAPVAPNVIRFSGYDWIVRSAASNRGGEMNAYDSENAWADPQGFLHLRMGERNGRWSCADVRLTHSLGYGTYRFLVHNSAHLGPSAVLGFFTFDEARDAETRSELDIELSQWGNPTSRNAQYVVQPYYVPENIVRFNAPAGLLTHIFRWEPGIASFKTVRGSVAGPASKVIKEHVFTSDVPTPAAESIHINLYDFYHSRNGAQRPVEVVIEKFEYLP